MDDLSSAFVEEMYRYRVALHDQDARVRDRVTELRRRREVVQPQIEEAEWEELVAPDFSIDRLKRRREVLESEWASEFWRLKNDAQFALVAARGVYRMALALRDHATDRRACVDKAVQQFQREQPDASLLRDIHEHFDAYLEGAGHKQSKLKTPIAESGIGLLDRGLAYFMGGKLFLLWEIVESTETLAASVGECIR